MMQASVQPRYVVVFAIGDTRLAQTLDENRMVLDDLPPDDAETCALIARGTLIGSLDGTDWDEAFDWIDAGARTDARCYRIES